MYVVSKPVKVLAASKAKSNMEHHARQHNKPADSVSKCLLSIWALRSESDTFDHCARKHSSVVTSTIADVQGSLCRHAGFTNTTVQMLTRIKFTSSDYLSHLTSTRLCLGFTKHMSLTLGARESRLDFTCQPGAPARVNPGFASQQTSSSSAFTCKKL